MRSQFSVKYLYVKIFIVLFGNTLSEIQDKPGCGTPEIPAKGNISPKQETYELNATVEFSCKIRHALDGPRFNKCIEDKRWFINSTLTPRCLKEVAQKRKARQSTKLDDHSKANAAIDGNGTTCSQTKAGDTLRYWEVELDEQHNIERVIVNVSAVNADIRPNITVKIRKQLNDTQSKECLFYKTTDSTNSSYKMEFCKQQIMGQFIRIEDLRSNENQTLRICEVKVLEVPIKSRNETDLRHDGKREKYSTTVSIKSPNENDFTPDGKSVKKYSPTMSIKSQNETDLRHDGKKKKKYSATEIPNEKDLRHGYKGVKKYLLTGIVVGVTTAFVSTIILVFIFYIIYRKYIKRSVPQSAIVTSEVRRNSVSSTDALHRNFSPPDLLQTYSDPLDDPRDHVYEEVFIFGPTMDKGANEGTSSALADSNWVVKPRLQDHQPQPYYTISLSKSASSAVHESNEIEVDVYGNERASDVIEV